MLYRIRGDIFLKIIISFLTALIIVLLPDYQYLVYRSVTPLTNQDIEGPHSKPINNKNALKRKRCDSWRFNT